MSHLSERQIWRARRQEISQVDAEHLGHGEQRLDSRVRWSARPRLALLKLLVRIPTQP